MKRLNIVLSFFFILDEPDAPRLIITSLNFSTRDTYIKMKPGIIHDPNILIMRTEQDVDEPAFV